MFRRTMALALAALLLMMAVSVAAASGGGLFAEMMETEYTDERLAALDAAAETISVSQTTGDVTVEVSQAWYEGNRVFVSFRSSGFILIQDGLELEDGSYADIIAGGDTQLEDGSIIGWKECIVPEKELADTQTFLLAYRTDGSEEKTTLSFTLNQHAYDQSLQGVSPATAYQAQAVLYRGKVDLKGVVTLTSPEQAASWLAWQEGEEETGTDVIGCWNLYQNGKPVSTDLFGASEVIGTDRVDFTIMFPFLDDLRGLTLVPEYSEAGDKPDEAIVLEPVNQE